MYFQQSDASFFRLCFSSLEKAKVGARGPWTRPEVYSSPGHWLPGRTYQLNFSRVKTLVCYVFGHLNVKDVCILMILVWSLPLRYCSYLSKIAQLKIWGFSLDLQMKNVHVKKQREKRLDWGMSTIQNLFTNHVQARHVRCTSGHVPFDPRFCFVPVDVHPVYETDGAPTQPWDVLFSISSSLVECDDMWCTTTTTLWNEHTKDSIFPQSSTFQCYGCKDLNWWNLLSSSSIGVRQQMRGASTHLCCLQCTLWTYCPLTPPGQGAYVENQKDSHSWRLLVCRPYFSTNQA